LPWLAYAVAWLCIEGPVLDEAAVAAPVITGDAGYPAGHPNTIVYRRGVTLLYQLGALQWLIHPDPWWISATRNVAFLFASAFVPFAVVVACTRRPAWGHVAAVLTLSETVCSAVGVYLMWVFPGAYSNGHFGIHLAVLTVVLVGARIDRVGGALVGMLPVIHPAMVGVVWPAVAGMLFLRLRRGERMRRIVGSMLAGLVVAAGVTAIVAWNTAGDVAMSPYDVRGDAPAIVRTFIRTTDPHRQPLPLLSTIGLVGPLAFVTFGSVLLVRVRRRRVERAAVEGIVLAGAIAWSWALGARALQALLGELPLPILMIMPARFANLGMLLVLPLAVAALGASVAPRTAAVLAGGLVAAEGVLLVLARHVAFVQLLPAALGVALGGLVGRPASRTVRHVAVAGLVAMVLGLAVVRAPDGSRLAWSFGLAFVAATATSALLPPTRAVRRGLAGGLAVACIVTAILAERGPHAANVWDFGEERQSAEETELADWLRAHPPPHAMILTPPFPVIWLQPKTGHPPLVDMNTLLAMTYFRSQTEPVTRLVREVFEIDYADPTALATFLGPDGMLRPSSPVWIRTWGERPCVRWREIGTRYGFDLVLVPRATTLRLGRVWAGPKWALYEIPRDPAACAAVGAP